MCPDYFVPITRISELISTFSFLLLSLEFHLSGIQQWILTLNTPTILEGGTHCWVRKTHIYRVIGDLNLLAVLKKQTLLFMNEKNKQNYCNPVPSSGYINQRGTKTLT